MKLQPSEAKRIITNIAFGESEISNREFEALRCGVQALSIVERLQEEYEFFAKSDLSADQNVSQILGLILNGEAAEKTETIER